MKKTLSITAIIVAVLLIGGVSVRAASNVFYSYPNYSIEKGKTTETQPLMRVDYKYAVAQLKVKSVGDGIAKTKFQLYSTDRPNTAAIYVTSVVPDLKPGTAYYVNIGESSDLYWRIRNTTVDTSRTLAGWSGELYYISSNSKM